MESFIKTVRSWNTGGCSGEILSLVNGSFGIGLIRTSLTLERFKEWRGEVEKLLQSPKGSDEELDSELRQRDLSLRVVVREIPSVFGDFY